jgi:hypothetical protein
MAQKPMQKINMELDTQPNAIIIIKTGFSKCKDGKYRNKL